MAARISSSRGFMIWRENPTRITKSLSKRAEKFMLGSTSQYLSPPDTSTCVPFRNAIPREL